MREEEELKEEVDKDLRHHADLPAAHSADSQRGEQQQEAAQAASATRAAAPADGAEAMPLALRPGSACAAARSLFQNQAALRSGSQPAPGH